MLPDPTTPARTDTTGRPDAGASTEAPAPTPSAMRRALRRARDGVVISVDEATTLLHARGEDLVDLCASAARVRDAGPGFVPSQVPSGGGRHVGPSALLLLGQLPCSEEGRDARRGHRVR